MPVPRRMRVVCAARNVSATTGSRIGTSGGSGDGGAYTTAADLSVFWDALFAGRIVSLDTLAEMVRPRSDWPDQPRRYGLGFHLAGAGDAVWLEGYDAGVSFVSLHQPSTLTTYSVMSNWSDGAWPIARLLKERLGI